MAIRIAGGDGRWDRVLALIPCLPCLPWNPHSATEYGICWYTGTRVFQSVLLSPALCEEKGLTKTQGLLGGIPPPPSQAKLCTRISGSWAPNHLSTAQCHLRLVLQDGQGSGPRAPPKTMTTTAAAGHETPGPAHYMNIYKLFENRPGAKAATMGGRYDSSPQKPTPGPGHYSPPRDTRGMSKPKPGTFGTAKRDTFRSKYAAVWDTHTPSLLGPRSYIPLLHPLKGVACTMQSCCMLFAPFWALWHDVGVCTPGVLWWGACDCLFHSSTCLCIVFGSWPQPERNCHSGCCGGTCSMDSWPPRMNGNRPEATGSNSNHSEASSLWESCCGVSERASSLGKSLETSKNCRTIQPPCDNSPLEVFLRDGYSMDIIVWVG